MATPPYATVARVKFLGGINAEEDYHLWRFTTPDELDAAITQQIAVTSAELAEDMASVYGAPTAGQALIIADGEAWLTLRDLCMGLKSRKVFGTHWALDQEDSSRFQELIDNEFEARAQEKLGRWLTVTETVGAFARPTFQIGPVIDLLTDTTIDSEEVQLAELAARARGQADLVVVTP